MEKQELSFLEISNRLHSMILPSVDLVIGIGRGGVVPASMVAHQLSCDLVIVNINYRDDNNCPRYNEPQIAESEDKFKQLTGHVLIVDDVSVTGKTLSAVKSMLANCEVHTLVCKGKADFVLFPEISTCVEWPWKAPT